MSELEKKAALADLLLEHLTLISALQKENEHLRSELHALETLTDNSVSGMQAPPDDYD